MNYLEELVTRKNETNRMNDFVMDIRELIEKEKFKPLKAYD